MGRAGGPDGSRRPVSDGPRPLRWWACSSRAFESFWHSPSSSPSFRYRICSLLPFEFYRLNFETQRQASCKNGLCEGKKRGIVSGNCGKEETDEENGIHHRRVGGIRCRLC